MFVVDSTGNNKTTDDSTSKLNIKLKLIVMIKLVNKQRKETFMLPQSINEIGFDYISNCVANIEVQQHYCIVAILTTATLNELATNDNKGVGSSKFVCVKAEYPESSNAKVIPFNRFLYAAPSDVFQGINANTFGNELSVGRIRNFIQSDKDLSLSIAHGKIFSQAGQSAAASVIKTLDSTAAKNISPTIDITVSKNVTCLDFKIIRITDIIGWSNVEGAPDTVDINRYIVANNLLELNN